MDATQFACWLQGFAELTDKAPTAEQWKSIREHLQLVFTKVTPPVHFSGTITDHPFRKFFPLETTVTC